MTEPVRPDSAQREAEIFNRIRSWDEAVSLSHTQLGLWLAEVEDTRLWEKRASSMGGWIGLAAPKGRSTCYQALKDVRDLADVKPSELAQVRQDNVSTLKSLSTSVRCDPDVLVAAQTVPSEQFREQVRQKYPDQHVSNRKPVKVMCDEPDFVLSVLDQAVELHDAMDRGHALEIIAAMARKHWELEAEVVQSLQMEVDNAFQDT